MGFERNILLIVVGLAGVAAFAMLGSAFATCVARDSRARHLVEPSVSPQTVRGSAQAARFVPGRGVLAKLVHSGVPTTLADVGDLSWRARVPATVGGVEIPTVELTSRLLGEGRLNRVFVARDARGQGFALKVRKPDAEIAASDRRAARFHSLRREENAIRDLENYGGPSFLGLVRFRAPDQTWRLGLAMEQVPGATLAKLADGRTSHRLRDAVGIRRSHQKSLRALQGALDETDVWLDDLHPGQLMATPDGRIVPLDTPPFLRTDEYAADVDHFELRLEEARVLLDRLVSRR